MWLCNQCNVQYLSETTLLLHKRINLHRKPKSGCECAIQHFKDVCVRAFFIVQIIEVFPGTGNKSNNNIWPVNRETTVIHKIFETNSRINVAHYRKTSVFCFFNFCFSGDFF